MLANSLLALAGAAWFRFMHKVLVDGAEDFLEQSRRLRPGQLHVLQVSSLAASYLLLAVGVVDAIWFLAGIS